jgi:hypothetical protein
MPALFRLKKTLRATDHKSIAFEVIIKQNPLNMGSLQGGLDS